MSNLTIQYNCDNYVELVHLIAGRMQTPVRENAVAIPARYGQGFVWAKNLPGGISVMVSDVASETNIVMERLLGRNPFYVLQFNEVIEGQVETAFLQEKSQAASYIRNSFVVLVNGESEASYIIPPGARVRSVLLIFERKHLLQYLHPDVVDLFLSYYFTLMVQTGAVEPIDADYRTLLDTLLHPVIEHPLPVNYVDIRCMLLLERFILQVMSKAEDRQQFASKLSGDEVSRLMRVEARLVKDYTKPPPTIESLSKAAAMSATKLKRDFKLLYGLPIYEYYQRHRMKKARVLLTEMSYSIKEVGVMVGYTNLSHFAVSFKKEFGVLPSELSARDAVLPIERID